MTTDNFPLPRGLSDAEVLQSRAAFGSVSLILRTIITGFLPSFFYDSIYVNR